ncbi:hypothetical protein FSP39_000943 [Pinctada imbricata]|uniref:Uncharacterized protein n=1 Tax=Pinctada imbricata TaxID=66713 RepID=A0AA89BMN3_PINIB|nr:hypothetical protein FSP39_000943 [Pinctada imbricata]
MILNFNSSHDFHRKHLILPATVIRNDKVLMIDRMKSSIYGDAYDLFRENAEKSLVSEFTSESEFRRELAEKAVFLSHIKDQRRINSSTDHR